MQVFERKGSIRLNKDTIPGVYIAPVVEQPVGYCFGGVVIVEYSYDIVLVSVGDQQLDQGMDTAPTKLEIIRAALDLGTLTGFPSVKESRWQMVNRLYDATALSDNYDRSAMRWWYKSDEVRPNAT